MKKFGRILKGTLLLIIFLGIVMIRFLYMDVLMLQNLIIESSQYVNEEYFIETTEITMNRNILLYNLTGKEKDILAHPYIQEILIHRKFPDSLEIKVKEREEYAIIPYNGNYLFVDSNLYLLRESDSYISGELPVLKGIEVHGAHLGDQIITDNNQQAFFAFDVYEALSVSEIYDDIVELYLIEDQLIVETTEYIDLVLGTDIDLPYVIAASQQVYRDLLERNQRNVTIVSKYKDYIYVETGTFFQDRRSNGEESKDLTEEPDVSEEDTEGDN